MVLYSLLLISSLADDTHWFAYVEFYHKQINNYPVPSLTFDSTNLKIHQVCEDTLYVFLLPKEGKQSRSDLD